MDGTVIVGGGQAGASAAFKLRDLGYAGPITLLAAEPEPPYQRPPLSKAYLLGEMARERLYLRPEEAYRDKDIALRRNARAEALDPEAKTVRVDDETLAYDDLILATGSQPRRLPERIGGGLRGVHTVRTLADIDAMSDAVREGARVLIVGGGYIGLEAAAVAAKRGLRVTLVEMAGRILERVAAPETSAFFHDLHTRHGVEIRTGTGLARLLGDTEVTRAELSDGTTLDVDLVIVGIGIQPDTALAEAAGLALDNGIGVDAFGRTSAPHVWAAGDCAAFVYRDLGRIRLESVQNAIDQAQNVAANIAGAATPYAPMPWFWSDQYDVKLQIAGLSTGYTRIVPRRDASAVSHWYYRDDTLLAIDAMNDPRAYMVAKRLLEAGRSPDPAAVADPATGLKDLLA